MSFTIKNTEYNHPTKNGRNKYCTFYIFTKYISTINDSLTRTWPIGLTLADVKSQ